MRRALTWAVSLPVMVVGSQVAHAIAYRWAYPQASIRAGILAHTDHRYLAYAPIVLGFLGAVEAVVFAVAVLDRVRRRPARALPPAAFLFVPIVGFALQEHLERFVVAGVFPWWTVLEPTFWRGLVLQVPLGVIALLIARLLMRTAAAVGDGIVALRGRCRSVQRPAVVRALTALVRLPRFAPLAGAAAGRAPPLPAH